MYVWYQDYCCKGDKKSWQWLEKAAPNYQGWLKKRLGYKWRSWFLASALGKNDLCLKNFRLKAETKFFSLSKQWKLYKNVRDSLATLCLINGINLLHLAEHMYSMCPPAFPHIVRRSRRRRWIQFFFNCHRCHHCVLLATGESTRLKRRPYLFQSAREIKEANSSKYQTSFRSLKRVSWRFCHKLSN